MSKREPSTSAQAIYTLPVPIRRKLAEGFRALAQQKSHKPADRRWFAEIADAWMATTPSKKQK
jgi:hypothetical protein